MNSIGSMAALVAAMVALGCAQLADAGPTKAEICQAAKVTAAGKKEKCLADQRAKEVKGQAFNYAKCDDAFTKAFAAAEKKAGVGVCPTEGDASSIESLIDGCFDDVNAALSGSPNPPCAPSAFPSTGQTTCSDSAGNVIPCAGTGQDGEVLASAALTYTDNGDGTVTDDNTKLVWEKKIATCPSIHCQNDSYTWADLTTFIAALNTAPCFAGHCDWRLPNVKELQSIINYQQFLPAVSSAFNDDTGTGCSATCTSGARGYWTSTSYRLPGNASSAWFVGFDVGGVGVSHKTGALFVRAVRGGL